MSAETQTIPGWALNVARKAYADSPIKVIGAMEGGALVRHFAKAINDAVMAERERCAKLAELPGHSGLNIAAAIRADPKAEG